MTKLKPYFEMDYLLPRTLMSALRFEQLSSVVYLALIPPDIIAATLCYYVKADDPITEKEETVSTLMLIFVSFALFR